MDLPSKRELFGPAKRKVPRGEPDRHAYYEDHVEVFDVLLVPLGARDPVHSGPEIVVPDDVEQSDQQRLHDERPREGAAHHVVPHDRTRAVYLAAQVVSGERNRNHGREPDEVADVAHPVVVGAPLGRGRGKKLHRCVCPDNEPSEDNVAKKPVDVQRHPERIHDGLEGGSQELSVVGHSHRGHHERGPGIAYEHQGRPHDVQQHTQTNVETLPSPQPLPGAVVQVEGRRFQKEEYGVHVHRRREDAYEIVGEPGVQAKKRERKETAQCGCRGEGGGQELRELVRQAVIALVTGSPTDELDDDREDRNAQHERREQKVELCDEPDGVPWVEPEEGSDVVDARERVTPLDGPEALGDE